MGQSVSNPGAGRAATGSPWSFAPQSAASLRSLALGAREQFDPPGAAPKLPLAPPTPEPTGPLQAGKYIVPQGGGPHVIAAGTELAFLNLDSFDRGDVQVGEAALVNNGKIISVNASQYGTMALSTGGPLSNATASITNNGSIYAHATGPDGASWGVYAHAFTTVVNSGLIQSVSDMSRASGLSGSFSFQNTASGILRVHAQAYGLGLGGGMFDNAGVIEVTGGHSLSAGGGGFAVREPESFNNSGTIRATSYSDFYHSVGLIIDEVLLQDYYNSGTIIAQYSYYDTTYRDSGNRSTTFHNSGSMIGDMVFGKDTNTLLNTGLIEGNVFFDDQWDIDHNWQDANVYDGRGGSLTGGLFLGRGSATAWLGDGGEAVYTSGGKDTVHGGAGSDLVDVIGGILTADGGGGYDMLSWYSSSVGLIIDAQAGTASGAGQTTSFSGFEAWIGSGLADTFRGSGGEDYFAGQAGDDVADGGAGDDRLEGGMGDDVVTGGGGADFIDGGFGGDTVIFAGSRSQYQIVTVNGVTTVTGPAGDGVDVLRGVERLQFSDQVDRAGVVATDGADALLGTGATDYINGLDGDDVLAGRGGDDHIDGADGADTAVFAGLRSAYAVSTVSGVTTVNGPDGVDTLSSVERLRFDDLTLLTYGDGGQYYGGGAGGDTLTGTALSDEIDGLAGDDVLNGGAGNDIVRGGDGADRINAGSGLDTASGDAGDDTFVVTSLAAYPSGTLSIFDGGSGFDTYDASALSGPLTFGPASPGHRAAGGFMNGDNAVIGVERIISGSGDDYISVSEAFAGIEVFGGGGNDVIVGGAGRDRLHGGTGTDSLDGRAGDELYGDDGDDTLTITGTGSPALAVAALGGAGVDTLTLQGASLAFDVASGQGIVDGTGVTASGMERHLLFGTSGGQGSLTGGDGADILTIWSTWDAVFEGRLDGRGGDDVLEGTYWNDVLVGGEGNDILNASGGSDRVEGGNGVDTAVFSGGSLGYTITRGEGFITVANVHATDTLIGIERLRFDDMTYLAAGGVLFTGTAASESIVGTTLGDELFGLAGDDTLTGGLGNDLIDGGSGHDILTVSGVASSYRLLMDGDNFILKGPDGGDHLTGVESIRFGDGRVLELNRMYGSDVDAWAWADGRIPEHLLSDQNAADDRPLVLPGVDEPAPSGGKGGDGIEVLPLVADEPLPVQTDDGTPLVLPGEVVLDGSAADGLTDWTAGGFTLTVDEAGLIDRGHDAFAHGRDQGGWDVIV